MNKKIKLLICKYAEVYKEFERFQEGIASLLPGGDQKTGVIAEYYAKCYIENFFKTTAIYTVSGNTHDIEYKADSNRTMKVQVKGVSAHSNTRTIAPLNLKDKNGNKPFDYLYLIDLDKDFLPIAFYINTYNQIKRKVKDPTRQRIAGSTMRNTRSGDSKGSGIFDFKNNKINELREALQ